MNIPKTIPNHSLQVHQSKQKVQTAQEDKKLRQSAQQLEGLFLSYVLKAMEKTIPKEKDHQNTLADMMFSSVMGKALAGQGGVGLSKFLYQALSAKDVSAIKQLQNGDMNSLDMNLNLKTIGSKDE